MKIEHHEGVVETATTENADGNFAEAVALASMIFTAQTAEIEQMKSLLAF